MLYDGVYELNNNKKTFLMLVVFKNRQYLNAFQITVIADDRRLSQEQRFYSGFYSEKLPITA